MEPSRHRRYRAVVLVAALSSVVGVAVVGAVLDLSLLRLLTLAGMLTATSLAAGLIVWQVFGDRSRAQGWHW